MIQGRWGRVTGRMVAELRSGTEAVPAEAAAAASHDAPPAPVARYLQLALPKDGPLPRLAIMRQEGHFRRGEAWSSFTATEFFAARPPAFVWDASIRMMPLIVARVRDSYLAGEGRTHAALGGLVTLVNQGGTPALASASLLRWLAEAAWLPTALLPRAGLVWDDVDDTNARVHVRERTLEASLDVRFSADGTIAEVNATRHRDVKGVQVLTPWRGRFASYARLEGMLIPMAGEVSWVIDGREEPYWRGRIVDVRFE